jgi:hypothetical protein
MSDEEIENENGLKQDLYKTMVYLIDEEFYLHKVFEDEGPYSVKEMDVFQPDEYGVGKEG